MYEAQSKSKFQIALIVLANLTLKTTICALGEGEENFHGKRRFKCQKQPLKIPAPKQWHFLAPKNRVFDYISINTVRRERKCIYFIIFLALPMT